MPTASKKDIEKDAEKVEVKIEVDTRTDEEIKADEAAQVEKDIVRRSVFAGAALATTPVLFVFNWLFIGASLAWFAPLLRACFISSALACVFVVARAAAYGELTELGTDLRWWWRLVASTIGVALIWICGASLVLLLAYCVIWVATRMPALVAWPLALAAMGLGAWFLPGVIKQDREAREVEQEKAREAREARAAAAVQAEKKAEADAKRAKVKEEKARAKIEAEARIEAEAEAKAKPLKLKRGSKKEDRSVEGAAIGELVDDNGAP